MGERRDESGSEHRQEAALRLRMERSGSETGCCSGQPSRRRVYGPLEVRAAKVRQVAQRANDESRKWSECDGREDERNHGNGKFDPLLSVSEQRDTLSFRQRGDKRQDKQVPDAWESVADRHEPASSGDGTAAEHKRPS
jgi:hypothetical protein